LTDGSPADDLICSPTIVISEGGLPLLSLGKSTNLFNDGSSSGNHVTMLSFTPAFYNLYIFFATVTFSSHLLPFCLHLYLLSSVSFQPSGVEIRGRDHHFLGKDDHVLTDGSPSDDLIFAPIIVLYEQGPLSFG
jgi:hypothetical protein